MECLFSTEHLLYTLSRGVRPWDTPARSMETQIEMREDRRMMRVTRKIETKSAMTRREEANPKTSESVM